MYLVEQVDCSSESQDQVDRLPVTVCQVGSHLEEERFERGTLKEQSLESYNVASYNVC